MADVYLMENGVDRYLLEDGSGVYLMEGDATEEIVARAALLSGALSMP